MLRMMRRLYDKSINAKLLQENFQFIHFFQRDFFNEREAIKNKIEVKKIGQRETGDCRILCLKRFIHGRRLARFKVEDNHKGEEERKLRISVTIIHDDCIERNT